MEQARNLNKSFSGKTRGKETFREAETHTGDNIKMALKEALGFVCTLLKDKWQGYVNK